MTTVIRWYVSIWAATAAVLAGLLLFSNPNINILRFVLFTSLLVLAEARPVKPAGLRGKMFVTLTFMMAVLAIMKVTPAEVTLISGLAVMGTLFVRPRPEPIKVVFNAAQSMVAAGVASIVYRSMGGTIEILSDRLPQLILATGVATATYFVINSMAVTGAISISTGSKFLATWQKTHGWLALSYVAFGASGILLAALYEVVGMWSIPLLMVPLLVARQVFSAYEVVSDAYEDTVRAFVSAIEAKDTYTRGHSERVADFGLMIARKMGLKDEALDVFYYGALLHDVGKLAVRKATLTKPAALDDAEFDEIKRHPVVGAQIVQEIEFLRPALDAVLYHHERLDGSGYPAGLVGDIVPPWARILAVADTYDAMTSTRAYRGARTHQEAVEELRKFSGRLYDEEVVEKFISAVGEARQEHHLTEEPYEIQVVPRAAH